MYLEGGLVQACLACPVLEWNKLTRHAEVVGRVAYSRYSYRARAAKVCLLVVM